MQFYKRSSVMTFLIVCLMAGSALADVPSTISFQGRMKDSTGAPYSGSKLVKFAIYDSTGTEIWNSGFNSTTFADGLVTVQLGASPHPALPIGNWLTDTALTLGITVDTDPEISPRIPFTSTGYAFHAGVADQLAGFDASVFVHEAGDTMSGSLAIMGNLSVGTDSSVSPLTVESQDNWRWSAGDGWGDVRIGDSGAAFNIGLALGGGGRGATRLWSKGGLAEDIYLGSPTSGEQFLMKGTSDQINLMSDVGINTEDVRAPLTVESVDRWSWAIDSGNGDFRIGSGDVGFNIGLALTGFGRGATRFWTEGGLIQQMTFGGDSTGDVLRIDVDNNRVISLGDVGIGTANVVAPLTLQSQGQSSWDVGGGFGDFRLDDGSGGLSIGVAPSGEVRFWSSGGSSEDLVFGNPSFGEMLRFSGDFGSTTIQAHETFSVRAADDLSSMFYSPTTDQFTLLGGSDGQNKVDLLAQSGIGSMWLRDTASVITTVISARTFGGGAGIQLSKADASAGAELKAGADGAGSELSLYDGLGNPVIRLLPGSADDAAVVFPDDAISNTEILDEPGIAFNRRTTLISNLAKSNTSQDFVTVNITTPAAGYIAVEGVGYFSCQGDSAAFGWAQVSETSNRTLESGQFNWVGPTGFGNTSSSYTYHSIPIKRFYFKTQGSYTFYLQGNAYIANAVTSDVDLLAPSWLQATYYPVAYGTASTLAESPGEFESATQVSIEDPQTGETAQVYRVDLRELELKSKTARLKALEAQQEALKADLQLQRARMKESDSPIVHAVQTDSEVKQ